MSNASLSGSSAAVSDSWRQWIAENKLLRASDQSMIDALLRNGIPEAVGRDEVQAAVSRGINGR